jgi:hypothetical protein
LLSLHKNNVTWHERTSHTEAAQWKQLNSNSSTAEQHQQLNSSTAAEQQQLNSSINNSRSTAAPQQQHLTQRPIPTQPLEQGNLQ